MLQEEGEPTREGLELPQTWTHIPAPLRPVQARWLYVMMSGFYQQEGRYPPHGVLGEVNEAGP